jgi:hypothetical protein
MKCSLCGDELRDCLAILRLVNYVKESTGEFHDREVSTLISAVRGKTLTEEALCRWRSEHKEFMEAAQ